jgi:hypothetical protein
MFVLSLFLQGESVYSETIHQKMLFNIQAINSTGDDDLDLPLFENVAKSGFVEKSKWKALGLSLIAPGAGQYYCGNKSRMKIFGVTEISVWTGFFGIRAYGGWKKEDFRSWAAFHAGADVNGKSDEYLEKLTYYDNLGEYNQLELLYEGSRAVLYPSTPEFYWNWDSDESRSHYRDLRNQSKNAYRRSLLILGVAVANRILSGIDAYRSAGSYNRQQEFGDSGWNFVCSTAEFVEHGKIEIGFSRHF